jgi:DNA-directed RNA polymerase subunit RPC12/RpoP
MISIAEEKRILQFLREGISQRKISQHFGISKSTVGTIKKEGKVRSRNCISSSKEPEKFQKLVEPKRCPSCGSKVIFWPCIECTLEEEKNDEEKEENCYG